MVKLLLMYSRILPGDELPFKIKSNFNGFHLNCNEQRLDMNNYIYNFNYLELNCSNVHLPRSGQVAIQSQLLGDELFKCSPAKKWPSSERDIYRFGTQVNLCLFLVILE